MGLVGRGSWNGVCPRRFLGGAHAEMLLRRRVFRGAFAEVGHQRRGFGSAKAWCCTLPSATQRDSSGPSPGAPRVNRQGNRPPSLLSVLAKVNLMAVIPQACATYNNNQIQRAVEHAGPLLCKVQCRMVIVVSGTVLPVHFGRGKNWSMPLQHEPSSIHKLLLVHTIPNHLSLRRETKNTSCCRHLFLSFPVAVFEGGRGRSSESELPPRQSEPLSQRL